MVCFLDLAVILSDCSLGIVLLHLLMILEQMKCFRIYLDDPCWHVPQKILTVWWRGQRSPVYVSMHQIKMVDEFSLGINNRAIE